MTALVPRALPAGLAARWSALSLSSRFGLAAALVLLPATLAIGAFVAGRIEAAVVGNAALSTALYVDSVVSPLAGPYRDRDGLSPEGREALEAVFAGTPLGQRVVSFKVWDRDGRVVWAQDKALVGRRFDLSDDLGRAFSGEVVASFDQLNREESAAEAATGLPLLEIYSPLRDPRSGAVVAVAEFYEVAPELARDLAASRRGAWAAVAAMTLGLGGVLWAIVRGGSRTIEAQRAALDARLADLRDMSARNRALRLRVQAAAARAAAQSDRTLRMLGADLHDGPAQHLAYAALRLDALRDRLAGDPAAADVDGLARAVAEAMAEIRQISRGLQLPDIAGRPLLDLVRDAAEAHEARTGHPVALEARCDDEPALSPGVRTCVFRFLQEGLANASRHAGGVGIAVDLACAAGEVRLCLLDRGPGLPETPREGAMGLEGLRDRVESLGGSFSAGPRPGGGAAIAMILETGGPS